MVKPAVKLLTMKIKYNYPSTIKQPSAALINVRTLPAEININY